MVFIAILILLGTATGFVAAKKGINPYLTSAIFGFGGMIISYFALDMTNKNGKLDLLYGAPYLVIALVAVLAGYFISVRSKGDVQ